MSIGWFRDLVICIAGVVAAGMLIFIAVLLYALYRRTVSILDSLQVASTNIKGFTSYIGDEVLRPVIQVVTFVQGIRHGISAIRKFFKKEKGGEDV